MEARSLRVLPNVPASSYNWTTTYAQEGNLFHRRYRVGYPLLATKPVLVHDWTDGMNRFLGYGPNYAMRCIQLIMCITPCGSVRVLWFHNTHDTVYRMRTQRRFLEI